MANVFWAVLMGILMGTFGIMIAGLGCIFCLRKKYLLGISLLLMVIVCIIGIVIFATLGLDNEFYALLLGTIGVISAISFFLLEMDESGSIFKSILGATIITAVNIFFVLIMSIVIIEANGDTHVVYEPYTIEVFEAEIKLQYDVENMPPEGYSVIKNKLDKMRENGENYYEGAVKLKYSCSYPLVRNNHDECSCTDERLCDICKEYVNNVSAMYD